MQCILMNTQCEGILKVRKYCYSGIRLVSIRMNSENSLLGPLSGMWKAGVNAYLKDNVSQVQICLFSFQVI